LARAKKIGSPPTPRKARTGELTPPGMYLQASVNRLKDALRRVAAKAVVYQAPAPPACVEHRAPLARAVVDQLAHQQRDFAPAPPRSSPRCPSNGARSRHRGRCWNSRGPSRRALNLTRSSAKKETGNSDCLDWRGTSLPSLAQARRNDVVHDAAPGDRLPRARRAAAWIADGDSSPTSARAPRRRVPGTEVPGDDSRLHT